jgi:uncharacterized membrane protein
MTQAIENGGTVIGVFDNNEDAQEAIRQLQAVGFDENVIGIAARATGHASHTSAIHDGSEKFAARGVALGLGTGAVWGLGILAGFLPGIGPAIAGGTLGVLLSNAAVGAAAAGLGGALIGLGVSDEDVESYENEFNSGKTIVTVKAEDRSDTACAILSRTSSGY